jgi:hypothetical protein
LVVLDGVNEAMSLHGMGIREEDGAADFRRRLVKPFTRVGAATLSADHVVKDPERRGRGPLGSVHKGNGLSGSLILLENAEPFGRGVKGRSHVYVTKDRPGHLRRHGRPDKKVPGKTFMGELTVDDTRTFRPWLELTLWAPAEETREYKDPGVDEQILAVVRDLVRRGQAANVRNVRAEAGMASTRVGDALTRLALAGALVESDGPRGSKIYNLTGSQDPFDEG